MAMLFDLDAERDNRSVGEAGAAGDPIDPIDEAFELIAGHVQGLEPRAALKRIRRYKAEFSAIEHQAIASLNKTTGNDRASKRAMNDGKTSRAAIDKAAKRGDAVAKNPDLIDKVADGDLSEEQLDVIADAAAKTGGAAAVDEDFINAVAGVDPDQAKAVAKRFISDNEDPEGKQSEHDRMRRDRSGVNYFSKNNGLHTIALGSDAVANDAVANENMWNAIKARADELYEADGGRDLATGLHPRSRKQLLLDAAYELICGVTTTSTGTISRPRHGDRRGNGRPQIFVGMTLDQYLGLDPTAMAEQIGLDLIPDTLLADYLEHADIIGVLYGRNGQPLWLSLDPRFLMTPWCEIVAT